MIENFFTSLSRYETRFPPLLLVPLLPSRSPVGEGVREEREVAPVGGGALSVWAFPDLESVAGAGGAEMPLSVTRLCLPGRGADKELVKRLRNPLTLFVALPDSPAGWSKADGPG